MTDEKERFLEAEKMATELLTELEALRVKADAHERAETSLGEARQSVVDLAGELAALSKGMKELVSTMGEIGTPEILQSVAELKVQLVDRLDGGLRKSYRLHQIVIALSAVGVVCLLALLYLAVR